MNDYIGKFSNIESPSKLAAQVIAPDIAMIKCYLDLTEMDQKLYAEFNKSCQNVTNSINASMQDVTNAINYCNINYCNQNTSQVYNFDPIKVPLPREEVNELNDLLSMILE